MQGAGDIGRGLALDIDPRYRGYEMWGSGPTGGMYTAQLSTPNALLGPRGVEISPTQAVDQLRRLVGRRPPARAARRHGHLEVELAGRHHRTRCWRRPASRRTTARRRPPRLSADILGDWREEVIWRESANDALRIYTTTIPTTHRFYTLMHDRQYRSAIAWQNTAYNQPPHPGFFLGDGMAAAAGARTS